MKSGHSIGAKASSGGAWKSTTGFFLSESRMNAVQIAAGKEPPVTVPNPPVPDIEIGRPLESSFAIRTAAEICGVYPANQALLLSSVVPVLAAAGRSSARAAVAVPLVTTLFRL